MNLLSAPVLLGSALVSSPLLYQGLVAGTLPVETVLTRFFLVMLGAWMAMSALGMLIGNPPTPARPSSPDLDRSPDLTD